MAPAPPPPDRHGTPRGHPAAAKGGIIRGVGYQPMTLSALAEFLSSADDDRQRLRLVSEFCLEYSHEPPTVRQQLLAGRPEHDDQRWRTFCEALADRTQRLNPAGLATFPLATPPPLPLQPHQRKGVAAKLFFWATSDLASRRGVRRCGK